MYIIEKKHNLYEEKKNKVKKFCAHIWTDGIQYSAPSVYRPPFYRQTRLSPKFSSVPISPITNTPLYCQTQLLPSATAFQTQKS
jgi:hypothetical protein